MRLGQNRHTGNAGIRAEMMHVYVQQFGIGGIDRETKRFFRDRHIVESAGAPKVCNQMNSRADPLQQRGWVLFRDLSVSRSSVHATPVTSDLMTLPQRSRSDPQRSIGWFRILGTGVLRHPREPRVTASPETLRDARKRELSSLAYRCR
jgi:hypothetical protein